MRCHVHHTYAKRLAERGAEETRRDWKNAIRLDGIGLDGMSEYVVYSSVLRSRSDLPDPSWTA